MTIEGILTTPLGALEDGRGAFLQDATGGIAVRLENAPAAAFSSGTAIRATGTVDDRYGQRTVRAAAEPEVLGTSARPAPLEIATGAANESTEGWLVHVRGTVTDSPTALTSGTAVTVDDGTGPVRVVVAPAAGPVSIARGDAISAIGPLGQRDSSGTGTSGYRVDVLAGPDVVVEPPPSPSPSPSPSGSPPPSPTPSPSPAPSIDPTPTPTPSPSPDPSRSPEPVIPIASARLATIGRIVTVRGVVTAEVGTVGVGPMAVIADETGAIFIRLPDDTHPSRATVLQVVGRVAEPYGQRELRPAAGGVTAVGVADLPDPVSVTAAQIGELVEARLVTIEGTLSGRPQAATANEVSVPLRDTSGGTFTVRITAGAGIDTKQLVVGERLQVSGVVGQRASRSGTLDGYRLWPRGAADIEVVDIPASPSPSPTQSPHPSSKASPTISAAAVTTIAAAIGAPIGRNITVLGVVLVETTLLDASGRRTIIDDGTGAIEVLLPVTAEDPRPGDRLLVSGTVGRAYGAPRIAISAANVLDHPGLPAPIDLAGAPGEAQEGRLVRIHGPVAVLHRLGDRWRAEVTVAAAGVVVSGLAGARIPPTALPVGADVSVVGVVRRPNPAATDRRWSVVPRGPGDVSIIEPAVAGPSATARGAFGPAAGTGDASPSTAAEQPVDLDWTMAAAHVGELARTGGLVAALSTDGFTLDDGTGTGTVRLAGDALTALPLITPGDAVGATGRLEAAEGTTILVVDQLGDLVRLGDLGEPVPLEPVTPAAEPTAGLAAGLAGSEPGGGNGPSRLAAGAGDEAAPGIVAGLAAATLAATALAVVVGLARRRRAARRLASRIADRLAAVSVAAAPTPNVRPPA